MRKYLRIWDTEVASVASEVVVVVGSVVSTGFSVVSAVVVVVVGSVVCSGSLAVLHAATDITNVKQRTDAKNFFMIGHLLLIL